MSTGTTAIEELERAALRMDYLALIVANGACPPTINASSVELAAEARRLRQRAAWVRELGRNADALMAAYPSAESGAYMALYKSLTGPDVRLTLPAGPIPSETAPAIAAAIDKTFEQDAGLLRRLADSPRPTPVQEAARMWREGETAPQHQCVGRRCDFPGCRVATPSETVPAAPKEGTVKS